MGKWAGLVSVVIALSGCGTEGIDEPVALEPDAGVTPQPASPAGVAPAGAVPGELVLADGPTAVALDAKQTLTYRLESEPGQHVAFALTFPTTVTGVVMTVRRWDGAKPVALVATDAGAGLRVLAAIDEEGPRTFWVDVTAGASALAGTLTTTRTPFVEGIHCQSDCARLLQLPPPDDARDGYRLDGATLRYEFGRRDLVMYLRYAGRARAAEGKEPFLVGDLSQWDGQTPGTDVGAPRHLSHQRGKDVDITLYGSDGHAGWRNFCTTQAVSGGTECVPGTRHDFSGVESAREIAHFYESGRVTMCFLDRELIAVTAPGAATASAAGQIDPALVPLFSDGTHLQHWPNHENHVHIRVSETATGKILEPEPFEAP